MSLNPEQTEYAPATALLDYYVKHGISPVRYDLRDLSAHFDRRDFLYRSLGLPPVAFRGGAVLEVAAGSGHNSLYVASCAPQTYHLVEPNPAGVGDINHAYASFTRPHTKPDLFQETFEGFAAPQLYDVVLCENWLGGAPNERALHGKLASLVRPGGAMVTTFVPHSGFAPNVIRHILAQRLLDQNGAQPFDAQTAYLVDIFGPHLSTMASMTRSHADWVRDCLQSSAYLPIALSLDQLMESVGPEMEALSFSPKFAVDWRWFKTSAGEARRLNAVAYDSYLANLHNFVDWRRVKEPRSADENLDLDTGFRGLHAAAVAWLQNRNAGAMSAVSDALADLVYRLTPEDRDLADAFAEALAAWRKPILCADEIRGMGKFGPLFGRELIYASFTRRL